MRRSFLAPNTNYHELHLERISVFTGNLLVAVLLNTWVLLEPETPQLGEISEPAQLVEIADLVLSDVKFLKVLTVLDVC